MSVVEKVKAIVRECAYHLTIMYEDKDVGKSYSRSFTIYNDCINLLYDLIPEDEFNSFIKSSWQVETLELDKFSNENQN